MPKTTRDTLIEVAKILHEAGWDQAEARRKEGADSNESAPPGAPGSHSQEVPLESRGKVRGSAEIVAHLKEVCHEKGSMLTTEQVVDWIDRSGGFESEAERIAFARRISEDTDLEATLRLIFTDALVREVVAWHDLGKRSAKFQAVLEEIVSQELQLLRAS